MAKQLPKNETNPTSVKINMGGETQTVKISNDDPSRVTSVGIHTLGDNWVETKDTPARVVLGEGRS